MRTRRTALIVLALLGVAFAAPAIADQHESDALEELLDIQGAPDDPEGEWRDFVEGWKLFAEWRYVLGELVSVLIAALLAVVIAYHPRVPRDDADAWERPKAIVLYAVVGALTAKIVANNPPMAFVVFGIGGLMRFRSLMGSAKDTGLTILVVVLGLACGLNMFAGAAFATGVAWLIIWVLEGRRSVRIEVRKLGLKELEPVSEAVRSALAAKKVAIRSVREYRKKGRLVFDAHVARKVDRNELERSLEVSPEIDPKIEWEWPA